MQILEGQDDLGGIEAGMGLAGRDKWRGDECGGHTHSAGLTRPPPNGLSGRPIAQLSKMCKRRSLIHIELRTGKSPAVHQLSNGVTDSDRFNKMLPNTTIRTHEYAQNHG